MPNDERATDHRDPALVRAEAEIAQTREQVARSLIELQRGIARAADWREWIRRKPLAAVAVAFGLGVLLGRRE
jgi:ElaB/YqjD/DUF883 family membrane-anchored ribosome-binding protein